MLFLEDLPNASFSGQDRVDLCAYISAVVALSQQQQREIEELKDEVAAIEGMPGIDILDLNSCERSAT